MRGRRACSSGIEIAPAARLNTTLRCGGSGTRAWRGGLGGCRVNRRPEETGCVVVTMTAGRRGRGCVVVTVIAGRRGRGCVVVTSIAGRRGRGLWLSRRPSAGGDGAVWLSRRSPAEGRVPLPRRGSGCGTSDLGSPRREAPVGIAPTARTRVTSCARRPLPLLRRGSGTRASRGGLGDHHADRRPEAGCHFPEGVVVAEHPISVLRGAKRRSGSRLRRA